MFVQQNTFQAIKAYFSSRLTEQFSENEIRYMLQVLVEKRLNWTKTDMLLNNESRLSESDLLYFRSAVKELLEGVPFQHIVGYTYFYDLKVKCDRRALVPRPETEELVEWVLNNHSENEIQIVDICTGTGCIALAIKAHSAHAFVEGWDVSNDALDLAKENASQLDIDVSFKSVDVLKEMPQDRKWDVIVSNPPYIPLEEKALMSKTVTDYDPDLALFVPNENPLLFYKRIGEYALVNLNENGKGYFEIHEELGIETMQMLNELGFVSELKKDMQGKDRMVCFSFSGLQ